MFMINILLLGNIFITFRTKPMQREGRGMEEKWPFE